MKIDRLRGLARAKVRVADRIVAVEDLGIAGRQPLLADRERGTIVGDRRIVLAGLAFGERAPVERDGERKALRIGLFLQRDRLVDARQSLRRSGRTKDRARRAR